MNLLSLERMLWCGIVITYTANNIGNMDDRAKFADLALKHFRERFK